MPVISALTYSQSDTTIVATWTTDVSSNSNLFAGAKAGIDNGVAANSTSHQCIVTGLSPNTTYSCYVMSGATSSSTSNVTTNAAVTRTNITSIASPLNSYTSTSNHGDSFTCFLSNDNNTYALMNDGYGFVNGTPNAGANMQVGVLTNEATIVGTTVNLLTAYGAYATTNGTDGPGGNALSNKAFDIMSMAGNLFITQARQLDPGDYLSNVWFQDYYGNIMMSDNHGTSWNSWQAPSVFNTNGVPPSPLGSFQFANGNVGAAMFVKYAPDDGTLGYLTAGNRIDGADGWVYMHYRLGTEGLMNGSNEYLMRIPRIQLAAQNGAAVQYWIGPTSPAPSDFVNDSNWSSTITGATAIYSSALQVSWADMYFIPTLNCYLYFQWYYNSGTYVTSSSTWNFLTGPTPAGPWSNVLTQVHSPQGWFHPSPLHRTVAAISTTANIPLEIVYSGDYNAGYNTYYKPTYSTLMLNPSSMNQYFTYSFTTVENPLSDNGIFNPIFSTAPLKVTSSGVCTGTAGGTGCFAFYTGQWFPANQYAEATIGTYTGGSVFVNIRTSSSAYTCYQLGFAQGATTFTLQVVQAGVATTTYTFNGIPVTGDVWRLEAIGSYIYMYQNGVLLATQIDTTITGSGYCGFGFYTSTPTTASVSKFSCGAVSQATPLSLVSVSIGAQAASSTNAIATTAFNLTTGNAVVAITRHLAALSGTPLTDIAGNTYVPVGSPYVSSVDNTTCQFYLCANAIGNASNVVTMHLTSAETYSNVTVWQVAGAAGRLVFDTTANNVLSSAGTTLTSTSFNTAYASEIVLVMGSPDAVEVTTALGNYLYDGPTSTYGGAEHQIFSGIQTNQTATMALASNKGTILVGAFGLLNTNPVVCVME